MGRRAKPPKGKAEAKRALARKAPKNEGTRVRDLEKRLAESLEREKATGRALTEALDQQAATSEILQEKTRALTEALGQQTATSEILRVISSSPTDIQPVLDTVAESAARLCQSLDADIRRRDGDLLPLVAHYGSIPVREFTLPIRGTVAGRAVLEKRTVQVADIQAESDKFSASSEHARRAGFRTVLSVPLMREGVVIGAISVRRTEVQLFTDRQVALLKTFADQAVIAIENVRLFTELQARNRDLTATSEILQVISRSPTDVQPVFDTIAANATRLCDAVSGAVFRFDGELIHLAAYHNVGGAALAAVQRLFPPGAWKRHGTRHLEL